MRDHPCRRGGPRSFPLRSWQNICSAKANRVSRAWPSGTKNNFICKFLCPLILLQEALLLFSEMKTQGSPSGGAHDRRPADKGLADSLPLPPPPRLLPTKQRMFSFGLPLVRVFERRVSWEGAGGGGPTLTVLTSAAWAQSYGALPPWHIVRLSGLPVPCSAQATMSCLFHHYIYSI